MATLAERLAQPDMTALADWQAAEALNAPDAAVGTTPADVLTREVYDYLLGTGEWGLIELYSRLLPTGNKLANGGAFSTQDQRVAALITFVRAIQQRDVIAATAPAVLSQLGTILDGLVTFGFISAGSRAAIVAMASRARSWAEVNGYPNGVTAFDVQRARGVPLLVQE